MNKNPTLAALAKCIKSKCFQTERELATSLGRSLTFVQYDLKIVLMLLGLITWEKWRASFAARPHHHHIKRRKPWVQHV